MTDWLWGGEGGEERAAGFLAGVRWCVEIGRFQEGGGSGTYPPSADSISMYVCQV